MVQLFIIIFSIQIIFTIDSLDDSLVSKAQLKICIMQMTSVSFYHSYPTTLVFNCEGISVTSCVL